MLKRYRLKRKNIYYEEERNFKSFINEFIWIIKLKLAGWKIDVIQ